MEKEMRQCPGCKSILPISDYPADNRYGVLSPECRQMFDEIIIKEGEFGLSVHRLIIDSYSIQHPPHEEIQKELKINQRFIDASVQSIAIHLIALYCAFEKKMELNKITKVMDHILTSMSKQNATFENLTPPSDLGNIKTVDIRNILYSSDEITLKDYEQLIWKWAYSAWNAWALQHNKVRKWHELYTK